MAKKKHSKSASNPISAKELVSHSSQSDPRFREDRVRWIYYNYQRSVTKVKTEKKNSLKYNLYKPGQAKNADA